MAGRKRRPRKACAACGGPLTYQRPPGGWADNSLGFYPVAHHLHCTGAFIGFVHRYCNQVLWYWGDHLTKANRQQMRKHRLTPPWIEAT